MENEAKKTTAAEAAGSAFDCLYRGDPRVCVLLGKQPPPGTGNIRRSVFAYPLYADGKYLLFHTLTRELLEMDPKDIALFADDRPQPASILRDEPAKSLYEHHFLVPENAEESRTYLELKDILVVKEELPKGITHYVILPTTTCNARCFYCFEQGMKYRKMDRETVDGTVAFIKSHKPQDDQKIHIHWFGGEPMCAPENIDRICDGLAEAGIGFTAEMTSNGSLFTEENAKKAAEKWQVGRIQITLDGMAEEYAKRKNYAETVKDPFGTVVRNIHLLLAAGIRVAVRLNADENNLGEIYRTVDFLKGEFTQEEKEKLRVYAHSLFAQSADGLDACPAGAGTDALEKRVLEINDYICRSGLAAKDLGALFTLKSHYCMVTAPECNVLIDAAGKLFACDAMPEDMRTGDVKTGIDPEAWNRVAAPDEIRKECEGCVFLPQCTEFSRCPNRPAYDECRRQEARRTDSDLLFARAVIRQKMKEKEEQEHVPD